MEQEQSTSKSINLTFALSFIVIIIFTACMIKLDYINDFIDETKTSTNDANNEYNKLKASDPNNSKINDSSQIQNIINNLSNEGKTTILFEKSGKLLGMIAVADKLRDDSAIAIKRLKDMHISSYI